MNRRFLLAVMTAISVVMGLAISTPAMAATPHGNSAGQHAAKQPPAPGQRGTKPAARKGVKPNDCPYAPAARFANRYNEYPGWYGCAETAEFSDSDGGTAQGFENGMMAWSPHQGSNMITSIFKYTYNDDSGTHWAIAFSWGQSDPFSYDDWLIHITENNGDIGQDRECGAGQGGFQSCNRTGGSQFWGPITSNGDYVVSVEGCDINAFGSHTCRQSWTTGVGVWVVP